MDLQNRIDTKTVFLAERTKRETKAAVETKGHEERLGSRVSCFDLQMHLYGFLL